VSGEGRNGMFALKLHEHYYDPTFRAFKTYFFFDDTIVCLGSNIETRDGVHRTETTLFQCWMSEEGMPVQINGQAIAAFPHEFRGEAGKPLTLLDPHGNGYYLPDGGAVRLTRATSTTRPTPRRPARRRCAWSYGAGGNL
jgi:chondroitin-sulfate-ABC endolyase/exolyase